MDNILSEWAKDKIQKKSLLEALNSVARSRKKKMEKPFLNFFTKLETIALSRI